jgi:hypothetical protein
MRNTATWISAVVLVLLAIGVHCSTIEYPNQVVNESPNGLSLEYPTNDGPTDSMLSYLISTTGATVNTDTSEEYPPYVEAKIFLGNMMYAGVCTANDLTLCMPSSIFSGSSTKSLPFDPHVAQKLIFSVFFVL